MNSYSLLNSCVFWNLCRFLWLRELPAAEDSSKWRSSTTPETSADREARVARVVSDAVKRVLRILFQPVEDSSRITRSQATVHIANDEILNRRII